MKKPPGGPKHARCKVHVQHPYPTSGWLCVSDEDRVADAIEFADYVLAVAVRHREIEAERMRLREPVSGCWLAAK